jgi:hypothetical protein
MTRRVDLALGLQELLMKLGQTIRQAVLSSKAQKLKPPSSVKPLKRPVAPFPLDLVPEPENALQFFCLSVPVRVKLYLCPVIVVLFSYRLSCLREYGPSWALKRKYIVILRWLDIFH